MRRGLVALLGVIIVVTAAAVYACEWGDANGDGDINVGDAVCIINYVFKGGPAPSCPAEVPALTTAAVSSITDVTAACGGTITADGGAAVTERGVCWSTNPIPTVADDTTNDGAGTGSFTSSITGLTASTKYYVRAYATNSAGTGYGDVQSFTTVEGIVTDIDGNVYPIVTIGTQVWMAENLRVTHYDTFDGEAIEKVTNGTTWRSLTTGAYCEYLNDVGHVATYGRLYNWYAINDSRIIAPAGWHVPSIAEWLTLIDYLGGFDFAGGKMKEAGTTHWWAPNNGVTNESGFTALGCGHRNDFGNYDGLLSSTAFWSSSEDEAGYAFAVALSYSDLAVDVTPRKEVIGYSVRCIKD